jgi:hypothetical protein
MTDLFESAETVAISEPAQEDRRDQHGRELPAGERTGTEHGRIGAERAPA